MVRFNDIQSQLETSRSPFRTISVTEVKNLAKILDQGERIMTCLKGWHNGRTSLLCATEKRIVILCMQTSSCKVYEMNYQDITDIYHSEKNIMANIVFVSKSFTHVFRAWRSKKVRTVRLEVKRHMAYLREISANNDWVFNVPNLSVLTSGRKKFKTLGSAAVAQ